MRFNDNSIRRKNNVSVLGDKGVVLTEKYQIPYVGTNNMNTIIISSVGTGKTRGFLKSNLLQKGCSFVITDTKGDLFNEFAGYLQSDICGSESYKIKLVNLKNPQWSNRYNPFKYMHSEEDIVDFATSLSINVSKDPRDSFWLSISTNLIASMCFFVFEVYEESKRNVGSLLDIYNKYMKQGDGPSARRRGDVLYKDMVELLPEDSMAKKFFLKCDCASQTWDSAMATVGQALSVLEYPKMISLMSDDDLELEKLGEERMALFINMDDTNPCYDFIAGLLYTQIFKVLYKCADKQCDFQLPQHVRFFMDDFANYKIPHFSHILSTCRSRGMSLEMLLQSESQLKHLYGCEADNLIANSTYVYIGSNDLDTQLNVAQRLGVNLREIQNCTNKTYVFFPEGKTVCDTKADYLKHKLYSLLKLVNQLNERSFDNQQITPTDFWSCDWNETHKDNYWVVDVSVSNGYNIDFIKLRDNKFDSNEESLLLEALLSDEEYQNLNLDYKIHQDLREIFCLEKVDNSLKYKIMLMHCDFVFTKNDKIIAAVEVDGIQHLSDIRQSQNDDLKNRLFEQNKIPLIRISAHDIRTKTQDAKNGLVKKLNAVLAGKTIPSCQQSGDDITGLLSDIFDDLEFDF